MMDARQSMPLVLDPTTVAQRSPTLLKTGLVIGGRGRIADGTRGPKKAALSSPEPEDQEPDRPSLLTVGLQMAKYVSVAGVDKPRIVQVGVSADHLPGNQ